MKNKILEFIKQNHPTFHLLMDSFNNENLIKDLLNELEAEGLIDKLKDKYYLTYELNMVPATITSIKERFAFATVSEDEDVYISINNLKNAFLEDRVLLKKISEPWQEKEEYEVVKITHRARNEFVGEVRIYGGVKTLVVEKIAKPNFLFLIKEKDVIVEKYQVIKVKLIKVTSQTAIVEPIQVIGNRMDVGVDVARIILSNNAPMEFNDEVNEQLKSIPSLVKDEEFINREDFTSNLIVTIDGEDAKDFDDAVEVEKIGDNYRVGVHIADVSYYVKENSPIDKEALSRATSLYVQDRVVPMLPFELSNGICSLNPHVNRLVTSCIFEMDKSGKILTSRICKGVINSKHRLTYSYVNKFLKEESKQKNSFTDLEKMILLLKEVTDIIRKKRRKLGSIELESTELRFEIDDNGMPLSISKREQDVGERLIEDLMITANEIVASTIEKLKLPMVYRVHGKPKSKKLESFQRLSAFKGYPFNVDSLTCKPIDVSKYLSSINNQKDKEILSSLLLRCMAKAKYDIKNEKHFGLASKSYTHFTSPIRRYPDLMVHRLIDKYIINNDKNVNDEFKTLLEKKTVLSSTRERRALTIERTVDDLLCAKYMSNHLGDEYDATIVSMITTGLFVEIYNGVQGFISFDSIPGDYYIFDESTYRAYGARKGKVFSLGDMVHVIVCNVDIEQRRIDFAIMNRVKVNDRRRGKKYGRRH